MKPPGAGHLYVPDHPFSKVGYFRFESNPGTPLVGDKAS